MEPVQLPGPVELSDSAASIPCCLDTFDTAITDLTHTWSGLAGSYSAPEDGVVLTAFSGLAGIRDDLVDLAGDAGRVLNDLAETMATLATRRAVLEEDIAAFAVTLRPRGSATALDLRARVRCFNSDAAAADAECASALRALHRYRSWSIGDTLHVATSVPASIGQGLAGELLQRYRILWVPHEGAPPPEILRLDEVQVDEVFQGEAYAFDENSLLLPVGARMTSASPELTKRPSGFRNHGVLSGNPSKGSPPVWARWGGRALAVVGAGITYWGSYTDRYNETIVQHPEWTESQRVASSAAHSAVVGSVSVVGGMAAAWGGAAAGAAVGSVFPGPGTLIGGIVGGIIGGAVGGELGDLVGQLGFELCGGDQ